MSRREFLSEWMQPTMAYTTIRQTDNSTSRWDEGALAAVLDVDVTVTFVLTLAHAVVLGVDA